MNSQALSSAEEVVASTPNEVVSPTLSFNQLTTAMPYWLMAVITLITAWATLVNFSSSAALFFTLPAVLIVLLAYKSWLYQQQDDQLKEQTDPQTLINPNAAKASHLELVPNTSGISAEQQHKLDSDNVITGYALVLAGLLTGVTAILGGLWILLKMIDANEQDKQHYSNILITIIASAVGIALGYFTLSWLVGYVIIAATLAWAIYRLTVGLTSVLES